MTLRTVLVAAVLAATLVLPVPAHAWGPLGHRLVAELAWDGMTPQARAEARRLLAGEAEPSLAGIANWADELRAHDPDLGRRSARWHYVNIAPEDGAGNGCRYDPARDCPRGDCVVAAIDAQLAILADHGRPRAARLQALKFVVHFVGDVHQPLHAGRADDRGGNTHQINVDGRGSNLHALWDSGLLAGAGLDEAGWLARLRQSPAPASADAHAAPGGPAAWAEASCRIVESPGFYPPKGSLDPAYAGRWQPVAERQLRLGGQHLAKVLNAALGG
ncbi:S1/P1 nuclease [Marilutibacter chinensis]|uniref:S1/P1 nuclease n=1 Tax=Marilutibacter chinensis TaxID=2912247 RepID=A0ABS9HXT5_9GAMM|nr:S1/P1 nuclease [Lysobacter chinensis]MCF7223361.1 S1/P1 nuclease [Lysobacter chinensis]